MISVKKKHYLERLNRLSAKTLEDLKGIVQDKSPIVSKRYKVEVLVRKVFDQFYIPWARLNNKFGYYPEYKNIVSYLDKNEMRAYKHRKALFMLELDILLHKTWPVNMHEKIASCLRGMEVVIDDE